MIEANALCFAYSGRKKSVLENVDWAISGGEFEAIVGPNGCGKTTLLRLLAGELSPLSGHIQLKGKRLGDYPSAELAQHRSVLTQSPRLDFDFSVREVVLMGRSPFLATTSHSENLAAIDAALKALDLEHFAHRIYPELSRGEKQRVQLARVLAQLNTKDPKQGLLLLDEPINHLDIAHQHLTLGLAREKADAGHAVVAVLHDLNLALQYASRVTVLHEASVYAQGVPADIFDQACLARVFQIKGERIVDSAGNPYIRTHGLVQDTTLNERDSS
tara:strand:- start:4695 stop:5516 length:822 start_codon:yes stop_codon:yes gene_type:complete